MITLHTAEIVLKCYKRHTHSEHTKDQQVDLFGRINSNQTIHREKCPDLIPLDHLYHF